MLSQTSYVGVSVKVRNIWRVAELYNSSFESLLAIRATEFSDARVLLGIQQAKSYIFLHFTFT